MFKMSSNHEMLQVLLDHGIVDQNGNSKLDEDAISINVLWQLYKKVENEKDELELERSKEFDQLNKYVQDVRSLSEERDRLTSQYDQENEQLKQEIKQLKDSKISEEKLITEMCRQEKLPDLIGVSQCEQVAFLFDIRSNLMEKLESLQQKTEKVVTKHSELEHQLHSLTSEDSELRNRMNNAMLEMGGMASKLNLAIQERDMLQREVAHLTETLATINALPDHNLNNLEAKTQIQTLQNSANYYVSQIERLTVELESCKSHNRSREAELNAELNELKEMNARYKDVNQELYSKLNIMGDGQAVSEAVPDRTKRSFSLDSYMVPETQETQQSESKRLIDEMQSALEAEERQAEAREDRHRQEMCAMEQRVKQLEKAIKRNNEGARSHAGFMDPNIEINELKAQIAELDKQKKEIKAECLEYQEKYHDAERDATKSEVGWNSCQKQLNVQNENTSQLKERNAELELELSKALSQLQSAVVKQNRDRQEITRLEENLVLKNKRIDELELELSDCKQDHEIELRKLNEERRNDVSMYIPSDKGFLSDIQMKLVKAETDLDKEKTKRFLIEDQVESVKVELEAALHKKHEVLLEVEKLKQKNNSCERKLLMMAEDYDGLSEEKMITEMSREQLEDVTNVFRVKMKNASQKAQNYEEKYRSLKQKHQSKIRKIRELFMIERSTTADEIEKLELRVTLAESALRCEMDWKQKAIDKIRRAEEEQRNAIKRENEAKDLADNKKCELNALLERNRNLDDANQRLQNQLSFLESQKQEMEKLVKRENQKKELNTLLSNLSLSGSFPHSTTQPEATDAIVATAMDIMTDLHGKESHRTTTSISENTMPISSMEQKKMMHSIKRTDL